VTKERCPKHIKRGHLSCFWQVGTQELRQEGSFTPLKSIPPLFSNRKFLKES